MGLSADIISYFNFAAYRDDLPPDGADYGFTGLIPRKRAITAPGLLFSMIDTAADEVDEMTGRPLEGWDGIRVVGQRFL